MPCESYQPALTEAAAANVALSREVVAHLRECGACRCFFAAEQQLFAAIDTGVHAAANEQAPASLLPRVRASLDERAPASFSWLRVGAVLAGAALVVGSVVVVQKMRLPARPSASPVNAVAATTLPTEVPAAAVPEGGARKQMSEAGATRKLHERHARALPQGSQAAVLVGAGQREAVDKLLAALSRGAVKGDDLFVKSNGSLSDSDEVTPLGIPEIEIKPLAAVSETQPPAR